MAPVNPVPVTVTGVPPAVGPVSGFTWVTVGAGAGVYVKWSALDVGDVPYGVVTVTSATPLPAGVVAVIRVAESTTTPVAGRLPTRTVDPATKPVPAIVTVVPPAAGPLAGVTPVTVGGAT